MYEKGIIKISLRMRRSLKGYREGSQSLYVHIWIFHEGLAGYCNLFRGPSLSNALLSLRKYTSIYQAENVDRIIHALDHLQVGAGK